MINLKINLKIDLIDFSKQSQTKTVAENDLMSTVRNQIYSGRTTNLKL